MAGLYSDSRLDSDGLSEHISLGGGGRGEREYLLQLHNRYQIKIFLCWTLIGDQSSRDSLDYDRAVIIS